MCTYTGLQFIPLRTPGGESASHIGIFVETRINKLSQKKASSFGMCLLEESEPSRKISFSPMFLETCLLSVNETAEDIIAVEVEEYEQSKGEKTINTCTGSISDGATNKNNTTSTCLIFDGVATDENNTELPTQN